ncbi:MAG: YdeI/OmpD-associated family protein [Verrucomicrobiota bacterium]|jgi:uncharacterized protein YdeI (YjbR/CyaY-like superfamily)
MNDLPEDFSDALRSSGLDAFFTSCAVSHRREYLKWIAGAKQPETRRKRIKKALEMLSQKRAQKARRPSKAA